MSGYIKLFRGITEWEWYQDQNATRVFLHCLLKANSKQKEWQGITVNQGEFVTSLRKLGQDLKLTKQQIRTALNKLKTELEVKGRQSKYTIIKVINWNKYQIEEKEEKRYLSNGGNVDLFNNPFIDKFKKAHKEVFGRGCYLDRQHLEKLNELSQMIPNIDDTFQTVLFKLKNLNFGFQNYIAGINWLFKGDNYTAILNGTYDKNCGVTNNYDKYLNENYIVGENGQLIPKD